MLEEQMIQKKSNRLLKIAILSISLTIQAAGAVAAAIPAILNTFSERSTAEVQALLTIPSIAIMIFIILSSWIIQKIGKKNTVILGLLIALIGGIVPAFTTNFSVIVIARILFGAGTGMYNSLTISLIGDYFTGEEQQTLLGLQSAVMTIGNSLATFLAGLLLNISWQSTFFVYLLIVPILFIFSMGFPKQSEETTSEAVVEEVSSVKGKTKISINVLLGIFILFLFFISFMTVFTSSALAIQELHLSNQGFLSTALAMAGMISSLFAMAYGKIHQVFKRFTPVFSAVMGILGFLILTISPNMSVFFIGLLIMYVSSLIVPYVYSVILNDVSEKMKNFVVSLAMVACNLGSFASPYVINFIADKIHRTDALSQIQISAGIIVIISILFIYLAFTTKENTERG